MTGVERIVSGGQTGVDRGALDAAIALGLPHGGWCPRNRIAEDGTIDERYRLREHASSDYADRTAQNVIDSDGTLILYRERLQGGTLLTHRLARRHGKPSMRVRLDRVIPYDAIAHWLAVHEIRVLNVAGPRGSSHPGIQEQARDVVTRILNHGARSLLTEEE